MPRLPRLAAALALALAACATPFSQARDAGREAFARGDLATAAERFQAACRLQPGDPICEDARRLGLQVTQRALAEATPHCAAGATERCLALLAPARAVSQDPELLRLVAGAATSHLARCRQLRPEDPEEAVLAVRCLEVGRGLVMTEDFAQAANAERARIAAALAQRARDAAGQRHPARAYALDRLAACLGPAAGLAEQSRRALEAELAVPLAVSLGTGGSGDATTCAALAARAKGRVRCASAADRDVVGLRLVATPAPTQHTVSTTVKQVQYKAGTRRVPNEAHQRLDRETEHTERAAKRARRDYELSLSDCQSAKSTLSAADNCAECWQRTQAVKACNRASTLEDEYDRAVREHNRKVDAYNGTPATLTEDVYDTFQYEERTHQWVASLEAEGTLVRRAGDTSRRRTVSATIVRVERPGFEPAGVQALAAPTPTRDDFSGELFTGLVALGLELVDVELHARASATFQGCAPADEDCWLKSLWYTQEDVFPPYLEELRKRVEQRHTGWPAVACLR